MALAQVGQVISHDGAARPAKNIADEENVEWAHRASGFPDFQARRLGIRYRAGEKTLETPHTLNGTAVTDRWLLALLENFRGEVPDVLRAYGAPATVAR